jgi:hypothetical protein
MDELPPELPLAGPDANAAPPDPTVMVYVVPTSNTGVGNGSPLPSVVMP